MKPLTSETIAVSIALRQASRARHSVNAGVKAAKNAGPEWDWLANDLELVAEKLQRFLEHARPRLLKRKKGWKL